MSFKLITKYVGDFELIAGGIILMAISCLLLSITSIDRVGSLNEFYAAIVLMYAIGYPIGSTAMMGMVSKATKSGPQGAIMGWFASAGSMARIIFPLVSGAISQTAGDQVVFGLLVVLLVFSVIIVIRFRSIIYSFTETK